MTKLTWLLMILCPLTLFAQEGGMRELKDDADTTSIAETEHQFDEYYHEDYDWDTTRNTVTELTPEEMQMSAVIVLDKRIIEIVENGDDYEMIITKHRIVRVLDDKGIDYYNKVYVPMNDVSDVIQLKARSISPSGEVTVLNEENIKKLDNYENYGNYTLFAMEGVQKGGEIEYIYTLRKDFQVFGSEIFQTWVNVKEADFTLITPERLIWKTHSFNGFPEMEMEHDGDLRIGEVTMKNIPALAEEDYSAHEADRMRIGYKLNKIQGQDRPLLTWDDAANHYYGVMHGGVDGKKLSKFMKGMKLSKKMSQEEQVLAVEDYLKRNIAVKDESGGAYSNPNLIMDRKYGNEVGLVRLYIAILESLDIRYKLVVSCSRYDAKFVDNYEDFTNFQEFLLYFPQFDKYISPQNIEYRLGVPPSYLGGNKGLFINSEYSGYLDIIKIGDMESNQSLLDAELIIDPSMEFVTVKKKQDWLGYRAIQYRGILTYVDEDQEQQFLESLVASAIDDADIKTTVISNRDILDGVDNKKPLTLNATYTSEAILESAGNYYLLKVGDVIGTQSELYQETERQTDIEFYFPNQYKHHIYFKIPDGYKVNGLDDAVISKKLVVDGETMAQFVSNYKIENGYVVIDVHEFYADIIYPKELYDRFREVINAASDFQKVVLVLEKE